jgi:hypothetical protein
LKILRYKEEIMYEPKQAAEECDRGRRCKIKAGDKAEFV